MITKYEILKWFQLNYKEMVLNMKLCDHNYNTDNLNPYHVEGSVWTHTLLAFSHIGTLDLENMLAVLLHDIGKPFTVERNDEKKRVSFFGHDGVSAFLSIGILKKFEIDFGVKLDIPMIFNIIALHTQPFKQTNDNMVNMLTNNMELAWNLNYVNVADNQGRFGIIDKNVRNYKFEIEHKKPSESDKELVLMMGLPNSGKSTRIKSQYSDYNIISRDDIVEELYPADNYNESYIQADHDRVNKELNVRLDLAKKYDKVVIDMVNLSRKRRRKILNRFKNHKKVCDMFLVPFDELMERNSTREGKFIPYNVYTNMMRAFLPPLYDEFDEINYLED